MNLNNPVFVKLTLVISTPILFIGSDLPKRRGMLALFLEEVKQRARYDKVKGQG